jgi:hypothetical protein
MLPLKIFALALVALLFTGSSTSAHFYMYDQQDESSFVFHTVPNHVPFAGEDNPIRLFPNPSGYRRLVVYHYDAKLTLTNANGDTSVSKGYFDDTYLWFQNYSSTVGATKIKVELTNKNDGEKIIYNLNTETVERPDDYSFSNSVNVPDNLAELTKFNQTNWGLLFGILIVVVLATFLILKLFKASKKTNKKTTKKAKNRK